MYFVFVDESGQPGGYDPVSKMITKGSSHFFTLSGFLVSSDALINIEKKVKIVKIQHGLPTDKEFKWNAQYKTFGIDKETYISFREKMISIICEYPNSVISTIIDKSKCYNKEYIKDHHDVYVQALHLIMERVQMELCDRGHSEQPVMFVFDSRKNDKNKKLDEELQKAYIRAIGLGTYYVNFPNFLSTAIFADSDYSAGVQLADYCAGPIQRNAEHQIDDWFRKLMPAIRKNSSGQMKGYGLKLFP